MNAILDALNEEQRKPVLDTEGAVLVTAGAGSGKTRLLTHRIAYLVLEKGVKPYHILAITFTNKAANEMKERLLRLLPDGATVMQISTFHSLCVRILRRFADKIGFTRNFSIYGEDEKGKLIKAIVKDKIYDAKQIKKIIWSISDAKNAGLSPDEYKEAYPYYESIDETCAVYAAYQTELRKNNALDYDDLLLVTYRLLCENAEALEDCRNRYRYIHVDEFQDTNGVQYQIVRLLASGYGNVFAVGDEDQCIYGWRGADFQNIFNFTRDFPSCRVYKLEENYRSTKNILGAANLLIKHNRSRLDKTLWTSNAEGEAIGFLRANTESDEAAAVVNSIVSLVRNGEYRYRDVAILMRLNALSRSFEEKLIQYGIPSKVFGGFKFFDRKEVKDLLAYLEIVANPANNEAVLRVINVPRRGIGDSSIAQLRNYASVSGESLVASLLHIDETPLPSALIKKLGGFAALIKELHQKVNECSLSDFVLYLIDRLQFKAMYNDGTDEGRDRMMHLDELIESVKQFEKNNEGASLSDYLQMTNLYSDTEEMDGGDYVSLATVHSAKGLEFKVVYIVGMENDIFPIVRYDGENDEEEERRLFYVAITRAKERLFVTYAASRFLQGERKIKVHSRFLEEAELLPQSRPVYSYTPPVTSATPSGKVIRQAPTAVPTANKKDLSGFVVGAKVLHPRFGVGEIMAINTEQSGTYAQVTFDKAGKLNLALEYAPLTLVKE
ncbi:MAG: UvrD-helicase domain-containing protein [Clostridiales bacterium]|nr:UvrD-helicase domain-containing protein [Clostridiales bacterium]